MVGSGTTAVGDIDFALDRHGDSEVAAGLSDFAVNVRGDQPPDWLVRDLRERVTDLASYPRAAEIDRARDAVARRHGRTRDEVLLLAGAAEGFSMLPMLAPRLATLIAPTFNEPERVLRAAGVPLRQIVLNEPWVLDHCAVAAIDDTSDLVVIGNPTNPTSVLHDRALIESIRRPGRIIVVDEAFADTQEGEPHSVAACGYPDVLVLRSLTKSFALAGLRAGYLLGDSQVLQQLSAQRAHWPLGTLQVAAIEKCMSDVAAQFQVDQARHIAQQRTRMVAALGDAGVRVCGTPSSSFVMVAVPNGAWLKDRLRDNGFAVRSCANFVGLGPDFLRLAVRPWPQVEPLVRVMKELVDEADAGN